MHINTEHAYKKVYTSFLHHHAAIFLCDGEKKVFNKGKVDIERERERERQRFSSSSLSTYLPPHTNTYSS
jgi:hypothetical protein